MSQATVLDFGTDKQFTNLAFPDLETRFEKHLGRVRSITDLEKLINAIKPLFHSDSYSPDEIMRLKKLRQRAYDRKRHVMIQTPKASAKVRRSKLPEPDLQSSQSRNTQIGVIQNCVQQNAHSSDPVTQAKKMAQPLAWFAATAVVSFFVWHQSLSLYQSAGFVSSTYAAAGGIIMLVGFAACHSLTRSWLALLLCIYAGVYEGYLMVSGTVADDTKIHVAAVNNDAELVFLHEKMEKEKSRYHELKSRYENPESKVFKNDWFLKTYLNPAWDASTKAYEAFSAKKSSLMTTFMDKHVTCLKILYRLGLVFLCMMLVHRFFSALITQGVEPHNARNQNAC